MKTHTLSEEIIFSGVGIHKGVEGAVRLRPSRKGNISFHFGHDAFDIREASFGGSPRGTVLNFGAEHSISTVEHLLGACALCNLWSVEIHVEAEEIPIGDGSAAPFVEAILPRRVAVETSLSPFYLGAPLFVGTPEKGPFVAAFPALRCGVTYGFTNPHPLIGNQWKTLELDEGSWDVLGGARTFGFFHEKEALQKQGLALGASLENTVVFDETSVMNPEKLRFPDECVRHKMLDLLGDIMVLGRPLGAHLVALRANHAFHLKLVKKLLRLGA